MQNQQNAIQSHEPEQSRPKDSVPKFDISTLRLNPRKNPCDPFASYASAALYLFTFGFKVIPIAPGTKQTAVKWEPWLPDLSPEKIAAYWSKHPDHELGFIVGDDIIVFDADSPEAVVALATLEQSFDLTPNFTVKTAKGVHHYFKCAAGTFAKSDSHSTQEHPERLDVKTGRAMVVLPPSTGKSIGIEEAESAGDLTEVCQDFIDAVARHNGRPAPRPFVSVPSEHIASASSSQTTAQLEGLLGQLPSDIGYEEWIRAGMVIYHETGDSAEGLDLFDAWSSKGRSYKGRNEIEAKWRSFNVTQNTPVTIGTLIKMVRDNGGTGPTDFSVVETEVVEIIEAAEVVETIEAVKTTSKTHVAKMPATLSKVKPLVTTVAAAVTPASTEASVPKAELGGSSLPFPNIAPHPEPVDIALLLSEISDAIRAYVIMDKEQADAAALWVAHTYLINSFETSPIAIVNAPEKACAKTLFQEVLSRMVFRPLLAANTSPSALFRSIGPWSPTLIIDEADTFLRDNIEMQGMINAGYKRGGFVLRSEPVGGSFEPRMFSVYGAKSIAGIALEKHLPDSTMSRGVIFNLRRKLPHEKVSRLRDAPRGLFALISSKLLRFAADYAEQLRLARPVLPDELSDRAQDNWEPLLAIAGCAGEEWVARATSAALILCCSGEESVSPGNELLADIQYVFESKKVEKISSADLIEALCGIADGAWATYSYGKQLTPRQLAKLLGTYKISPKTVRMKFGDTPKGYDLGQFRDVFARYLAPSELPQQRNVSPEAMPFMAPGVALDPHTPTVSAATPPLDVSATQKTLLPVPCGGVADVAANTEGAADMPQEDAF